MTEYNRFYIDNHLIELYKNNNIINIYYNYNNNNNCIELYYLIDKEDFLYHYKNILTDRQKNILKNKIIKFLGVASDE